MKGWMKLRGTMRNQSIIRCELREKRQVGVIPVGGNKSIQRVFGSGKWEDEDKDQRSISPVEGWSLRDEWGERSEQSSH